MMRSNLDTPQRQASIGIIVMYLANIKQWANLLLVAIVPVITGQEFQISFWGLASAFLVVLLVWTILEWKNFYFHIGDGNFIINEGVFRKEETLIPLERIQSVQLNQGFISQLLELAALEIDTAGSGKKEVKIPALKFEFAETIKQHLIALKSDIGPQEPDETPLALTPLVKFSITDMVKVGLTENHLKMAVLIIGVFTYLNQYSSIFGYDEDDIIDSSIDYISLILPVFITIYLLTTVGLSLFFTVIKFFNLTVFVSNSGLSVKSGLFKVEDNFVPLKKMQFMKWQSNPLQRLIGYKSLAIFQASSEAIKSKKAVMVPGCQKQHRDTITQEFYPEVSQDQDKFLLQPEPFWKLRLYFFFVFVPLLIVPILYYFEQFEGIMGVVAYVILSAFFVFKYTTNYKVTISENLIMLNHGYVFTEHILLKVFKVQNVAVKQNIFQKRRGLVSLRIYTASGSFTIPYIDENLGVALTNKLLYDVESNNQSWM